MTGTFPNGPQPCLHCHGSGFQARGCNIWPCDVCGGSGVDTCEKGDDGPETPSAN